jgi:hypothetical protein
MPGLGVPAISCVGVESSTTAGNEAAINLLCLFFEYFLRSNRELAAVDDDDSDDVLVEQLTEGVPEKDSNKMSLRELVQEWATANKETVPAACSSERLSLRELVVTFQGANKPLFNTRLLWGQIAYWLTFTAEKKNGDLYKHSTAKGYLLSMLRLVKEECEALEPPSTAVAFFDDAQTQNSWLKKIQYKMERYFAKRAAEDGEGLVKKAHAFSFNLLKAACQVRS